MKQSQKQIDQSQRIFPLSPNESDVQFNGFSKENGQNVIKKKIVNREEEKNGELANLAGIQEEKHKIEVFGQSDNKEEAMSQSEVSEKYKSEFQKKFENVTWYKLIYLVSEAIQRWKSTLKAISMDFASQNQIEMINDLSFYQTEQSKQRRIDYMNSKNKTINFSQNKFIRRLKKKTRQLRKSLREVEMKIQDCTQFIYKRVEKVLKNITVFDPYDNIVLFWEILYMALCLFLFVYLPFSVAFENERSLIISGVGFVIIVIFLGIDFIKNFNTAVYVKGELIKNHLQILKVYTYSLEFPLDVLTYFSAIGLLQFNYSRAIFLARIFYKQSLIQKFKDAFQMSEKSIASVDLLKLFAIVLYLCHIVACVWYKIGEIQYDSSKTGWIAKFEYHEADKFTLYVNSYFFSIIMMSSVKGNIQPSTNAEKIFTTLIAFGACVLFGYTITSITIILRNLNTKWDNFNLLVSQVTKFMRRYNVDPQQQQKARKYIEYVKDVSLEEKRKSQSVLNCLSKQLKDEIFINIYTQQLLRVPFIKNYFSPDCIEQLALKMSAIYYASDDPIISRQQVNDPALYFVVEGQVIEYYFTNFELQNSIQEKVIRVKNKGEYVGLIEFITQNQKPFCYAKSKGVTELHMLKLKDFLEVIAKFPIEKEHYYYMKDQILINRKTQYTQIDCSLCQEKDHIERNCHFTFYDQRKKLQILKYGVIPDFNKEETKRVIGRTRYNSLSAKCQIELQVTEFINNMISSHHQQNSHHNHAHNHQNQNHNHNNHITTGNGSQNIKITDQNGDNKQHNNQTINEQNNEDAQNSQNQQEQNGGEKITDRRMLKQIKKQQKMISIMNMYNNDKQLDTNFISVNFQSPHDSDTQRNLLSNFMNYDQNDQMTFDQEDLVLLAPSVQEDHNINSEINYAIKDPQKQSQVSNIQSTAEFNANQEQNKEDANYSSSIHTFTPNNRLLPKGSKPSDGNMSSSTNLNLMKNNFFNENNQQLNQNNNGQQYQQQDLLHPNSNLIRKQQSITFKSYEEIIQLNNSNNNKQSKLNDGQQQLRMSQQLQVQSQQQIQLQQQNQQQQQSPRQQIYPMQQQQNNLMSSLVNTNNDQNKYQIDFNEGKLNQNDLKLSSYYETQNVSIDYSAMHNFQYYFPHNNFNYIIRVDRFKTKAKQRRSVMNPIIDTQDLIKKTKSMKSQKSYV